MNTTPNINLSTYTSDPNDKFNLLVTFNNNMNKIDTAIGNQNDQIDVIEETASTAVTTANTASTTANTALTTANSKASIDDLVSSGTTTYSSDKIDDLISGIQPGSEIDDSITSTTKTWSSSKINTEIGTKASINDTTAGNTTTYSSNKIENLTQNVNTVNLNNPDTNKFSLYYVSYSTNNKIATISGLIQFKNNYSIRNQETIVSNLPFNFLGAYGQQGTAIAQNSTGSTYKKLLYVFGQQNEINIDILDAQSTDINNKYINFTITGAINWR